MRVLGIDPGLTRCGLGVVDGRPGTQPQLVAVDVVRTPAGLDTARRLVQIESAIDEWLLRHRPDAVAVERVFAQHNVQTVMGTAQAAGVAMLVAARRGLPVALHTPSEVKAAITGSGPGGQGSGGHDGDADPAARRDTDTRGRRGRAGPRHLSRVARCGRLAAAGGRRGGANQGRRAAVIAQLTGTVLQVGPTSAVIEVGGFGVLALCSPDTTATLRVGERTTLATSLVVREDSLTLYGFASHDEREFFELLQTATGVGPKLAQAALAVLTPGRAAERDRDREPHAVDEGARHRPQGRAAAGDRAQGQDQPDPAERGPAAHGRSGSPRPGASRCPRACRGSGWSARDAEAACTEVEPMVAADPGLSVSVIMRAALQTLARR